MQELGREPLRLQQRQSLSSLDPVHFSESTAVVSAVHVVTFGTYLILDVLLSRGIHSTAASQLEN